MNGVSTQDSLLTAVVVNDDLTQLEVLCGLVEKAGLSPLSFEGPEAALAAMDPDAPPALIVTDLYMPGIDGWHFCRLLHSPEYSAFNDVPILVVSATFSGAKIDEFLLDLGAEAFISAPVNGKKFLEQVKDAIMGKRKANGLKALIVEDDTVLANLIRRSLEANGYRVDVKNTFKDALEAITSSSYDVAALDHHLPVGTGTMLLESLLEKQADCCCVMLTSDANPDLPLDWMRRGAAAYVRKPFRPDYLIELFAKSRRERALLRTQSLLELRTRELLASEDKFRTLVENSSDSIIYYTPEGSIIHANQAFATLVGKDADEIIGMTLWEVFSQKDADLRLEHLRQAALSGMPLVHETQFIVAERPEWYLATINPIKDETGEVTSLVVISKNITEQRRNVKWLESTNTILQTLWNIPADAVIDLRHITERISNSIAAITKSEYALYGIVGKDGADLAIESFSGAAMMDCAIVQRTIHLIVKENSVWKDAIYNRAPVIINDASMATSLTGRMPFGHSQISNILVVPVISGARVVAIAAVANCNGGYSAEDGVRLSTLINSIQTVIERFRSMDSTRKSEITLQSVLNAADNMIGMLDVDFNVLAANTMMANAVGESVDSLIGKNLLSYFPPEIAEVRREKLGQVFKSGEVVRFEEEYKGRMFWSVIHPSFDLYGHTESIVYFAYDITERRIAEHELQNSKEQLVSQNLSLRKIQVELDEAKSRYFNLYDLAPVGYATIDAKGCIVEANLALAVMLDRSRTDLIGASIDSFIGTRFQLQFTRVFLEALEYSNPTISKLKYPIQLELDMIRSNDSSFSAQLTLSVVYDSNDRLERCLVVSDITELSRIRDELYENSLKYKQLFEQIPEPLVFVSPEGLLAEANQAGLDMLEYSREEAIGMNLNMFYNDTKARTQLLEILFDKQFVIDFEAVLVTKSGTPITCLLTAYVRRDRNRDYVGIECAIKNITDRKRSETELKASEERYRLLFQNAQQGILVHNASGVIVEMNPAAINILGARADKVINATSVAEIFPVMDEGGRSLAPEEMPEVLALKEGIPIVGKLMKIMEDNDVDTKWIEVSSRPVINASDNRLIQLITTLTDETAYRNTLRNHIARESAEQASQAKSHFLSDMSHEIRTPLNAILGFAQVLQHGELTPSQRSHIETIINSGDHLLELINNILDMSKIESGRVVMNEGTFSLHDLFIDAHRMFQGRAINKGLTIAMELDETLPAYAIGDGMKIRQVIINLLGNAVKFTDDGMITLRARAERQGVDTRQDSQSFDLHVDVEDTGSGITTIDSNRIFSAFYQADGARQMGGTGLGLAISQNLVMFMGGRISLAQREGKGSCFQIVIPLKETISITMSPRLVNRIAPIGLEPGSGPYRILVVDDDATNRNLLLALLEPLGFETEEACNGAEAIEVFDRWSPHVVLMDLRMPVMDGLEATQRIKASMKGKDAKIIAVTASVFEDSKREVLDSGIDLFLSKPFLDIDLFQDLEQLIGLKYMYPDSDSISTKIKDGEEIVKKVFVKIPEECLIAMEEAVFDGDIDLLKDQISRVAALDPVTARILSGLADRYDYATLAQWLNDTKGGTVE